MDLDYDLMHKKIKLINGVGNKRNLTRIGDFYPQPDRIFQNTWESFEKKLFEIDIDQTTYIHSESDNFKKLNSLMDNDFAINYYLGGVGSGKTTTINYFFDEYEKKYINIIYGIFDIKDIEEKSANRFSPTPLYEEIAEYFIVKLSEYLNDFDKYFLIFLLTNKAIIKDPSHIYYDLKYSITDNNLDFGIVNICLQHYIDSNMDKKYFLETIGNALLKESISMHFSEILEICKTAIKQVITNKVKQLKYVFYLIDYCSEIKLVNSKMKFVIVLDNLDTCQVISPNDLFINLKKFYKYIHFKLFIVMRKGTYVKILFNAAVNVLNTPVDHESPNILQVLVKRLETFLTKHENENDIEIMDFCLRIKILLKVINNDNLSIINNFIKALSGSNVRKSFSILCNLLDIEWEDKNVKALRTPYFFNRCLISYPCGSYRTTLTDETKKNNIINLFQISNGQEFKNLLLKPYILSFLINNEQKKVDVTIEKLITSFSMFFSLEDIYSAVTKMMQFDTQLIYTNGKTVYYDQSDFEHSKRDFIFLTSAGKNHIPLLIGDVSYLTEIIVDVSMDESYLDSSLFYSNFIDRFTILFTFLRCIEITEIGYIFSHVANTEIQVDSLRDYYPIYQDENLLISHFICKNIEQSINNIFKYRKKLYKNDKDFNSMMESFQNLNNIFDHNNTLLSQLFQNCENDTYEILSKLIIKNGIIIF